MKIAVMTDSTSYLSQDLIDKYNIQIAPLSVTFDDGKNFTESNEIAIEEFYNKMASSQTIPTTSQPAIGEWITKYEMLEDQGYTDIIVICLSSGLVEVINLVIKQGKWLKVLMYMHLIVSFQQ